MSKESDEWGLTSDEESGEDSRSTSTPGFDWTVTPDGKVPAVHPRITVLDETPMPDEKGALKPSPTPKSAAGSPRTSSGLDKTKMHRHPLIVQKERFGQLLETAGDNKEQLKVKFDLLMASEQTDVQKARTLELMNDMVAANDDAAEEAFYQHVDEEYLKPTASPALRVLGGILIGLGVCLLVASAALFLATVYAPAIAVATTTLPPVMLPKLPVASIACAGAGLLFAVAGFIAFLGGRPSTLACELDARSEDSQPLIPAKQ